jgi:hypothetical protein
LVTAIISKPGIACGPASSGDDLTQHEWRDIGADNKEQ